MMMMMMMRDDAAAAAAAANDNHNATSTTNNETTKQHNNNINNADSDASPGVPRREAPAQGRARPPVLLAPAPRARAGGGHARVWRRQSPELEQGQGGPQTPLSGPRLFPGR
eukprot:1001837-Rhodomonas_salina.1